MEMGRNWAGESVDVPGLGIVSIIDLKYSEGQDPFSTILFKEVVRRGIKWSGIFNVHLQNHQGLEIYVEVRI